MTVSRRSFALCLPLLAVPRSPIAFQGAEEDRAAALESERALHDQALADLEEGWASSTQAGILVLHQDRERDALRAAEQAEHALGWLEESFGSLAPDAYVRRPILRYFSQVTDRLDWPRARTGLATWLPARLDVLAAWDGDGDWGYEVGYTTSALVHHWLQHKDPELLLIMPPWVYWGIADYLGSSRFDRHGKLAFRLDDWSRDYLTVQTQRDRGWKPIDVFQRMTEAELGPRENMTHRARYCQTDALVRYLLTDGDKRKPTQGLLLEYLQGLQRLARDFDERVRAKAQELRDAEAEQPSEGEPDAYGEPEEVVSPEEELARWRRAAALALEADIVREMHARVFAEWKEADWKKFEQAYFRFLD